MTCRGMGIFSIGNINPLRIMVGSIVTPRDINMAVCWVFELIEINNPNANDVKINRRLSAYKSKILPFTGRCNSSQLNNKMDVTFISETITYGTNLEKITINGWKGETNNTSMVPSSFSRTIEMDVIITQISHMIMDIIPGIKTNSPFISGLYNMRISGTICKGIVPLFTSCSW